MRSFFVFSLVGESPVSGAGDNIRLNALELKCIQLGADIVLLFNNFVFHG